MTTLSTVVSDDWGQVAHVAVAGRSDVERGIRHLFVPSTGERHIVLVAAEDTSQIVQAQVNGRPMQAVQRGNRTVHMVVLNEGEAADVSVRVALTGNNSSTDIHLGFFRRIGKKAGDLMRRTLDNLNEKCLACKTLVRSAIAMATGGADLAGEALDRALEELEDMLDDMIGDTILGEILDALRSIANPGRLAASEICKKLSYCK